MSCIRCNTPAQSQPVRDYWPVELVSGRAGPAHPIPADSPTKIARLHLLAAAQNAQIRESVAGSSNRPRKISIQLARDPADQVRCCVARNERTSGGILRPVAGVPSERVHGFLAVNFFAPMDRVASLSVDASATICGLIALKREHADVR